MLLVDHADNCNSGGPQDTIDVIAAALRHGLTGIAAGSIADPAAVARLYDAGEGAEVELYVGGCTNLSPVGCGCGRLLLGGNIIHISDGRSIPSIVELPHA